MAKSAWKVGAAFGALLLLWAAVQLYVWMPAGMTRDSLVYSLKVPAGAKRAPLWDPHDEPTYARSASAGIVPDTTTIRYPSKSALSGIERNARAEGYECQRLGPLALTCDRTRAGVLESQVTASYEPKNGLSEVTVFVPD